MKAAKVIADMPTIKTILVNKGFCVDKDVVNKIPKANIMMAKGDGPVEEPSIFPAT